MQITTDTLRLGAGCTTLRAAAWAPHIQRACQLFAIATPARVAAFLAQIGHESGHLIYTRELWGPTPAQVTYERDFAAPWVRLVGGQRHRNTKPFDLGNAQKGDGRRYMGRGLIQTTGRANYAATRDGLRQHLPGVPDFESDPATLEHIDWAALSAAWFWHSRNLNALADAGDFVAITRKVNGGTNGLPERLALWAKAKEVLQVTA